MSLESDCENNTTYSSDDSERMYIVAPTPASYYSSSPVSPTVTSLPIPDDSESKIILKTSHMNGKTRSAPSKLIYKRTAKMIATGTVAEEPGQSIKRRQADDQGQVQPRLTRRSRRDVFQKKQIEVNVTNIFESKTQSIRPNLRQTSGKRINSNQTLDVPTVPDVKKTRKRQIINEPTVPLKTKKRRTRSYRNSLIHRNKNKTNVQDQVKRQKIKTFVVDPVEQDIDLDAEIDRVLEEKAIKNNLTATNVKSIIRQVITNNMVQKMMMLTLRNERKMGLNLAGAGNGNKDGSNSGGDDDENLLDFEPKLTRAKTKELFESQSVPSLWPITPIKLLKTQPPSEAQILITSHDLPEDSEGEDEEYVPTEKDLQIHSDDENSMTSLPSDFGSPTAPKQEHIPCSSIVSSLRNRRGQIHQLQSEVQVLANDNSVFKTPQLPRRIEKRLDCAIGLRTRSKLPLNDTPLEDLEMQLIPPDITKDMYDFGKGESDNEDYLAFLKGFACTGRSAMTEGNEDEEEADPEYNVMEDEEEDHDKEEHRVDRAVKITKKELSELVAELFDDFDDCHFSSGEEFEDFSTLNQQQPFAFTGAGTSGEVMVNTSNDPIPVSVEKVIDSTYVESPTLIAKEFNISPTNETNVVATTSNSETISGSPAVEKGPCIETDSLFSEKTYELLNHQMTQHVQLLVQSYLFSVSRPESSFQKIALEAQSLVTNLWNMSCSRGAKSVYSACNLKPAVQLLANCPKRNSSSSPIKKKILEETYLNELCEHNSLRLPGWIVRLICGSNVFMHGCLLPSTVFNYDPNSRSVYFTPGEDSLIAHSLSCLADNNLNLKEIASIISKVLLVIRTPSQVYSRIRNIRSHKPSDLEEKGKKRLSSTNSPLYQYFQNKTLLPVPHIPHPDNFSVPLAPLQQPSHNLPSTWLDILETLNTNRNTFTKVPHVSINSREVKSKKELKSSGKYVQRTPGTRAFETLESVNDGLPISIVRPIVRTKPNDIESCENVEIRIPATSPLKKTESVDIAFPKNFQCLSEIDENSTAIPVYNYKGEPEVYYIVPSNLADPEYFHKTNESKENVSKLGPELTAIPDGETLHSGSNAQDISECQMNRAHAKKSKKSRGDHSARTWIYDASLMSGHQRTDIAEAIPSSEDESDVDDDEEEFSRFLESDYLTDDKSGEETDEEKCDIICEDLKCPEMVDLCCSSEGEEELKNSNSKEESQNNSDNKEGKHSENQNNSDSGASGEEGNEFLEAGHGGSAGDGRDKGSDDENDKDRKKNNNENKNVESPKKTDETEDEDEDDKKQKQARVSSSTASPTRRGGSGKAFETPRNRRRVSSVKKLEKQKSPIYSGKLSGKRASKYNTGSPQLLLIGEADEGDCSDGSGTVRETYLDTFLLRVQHRVEIEGKNPGLYNTLIQSLCDFNSSVESCKDLFLRMEDMLKDYPDLIKQFAGFFTSEDAVETGRFLDHQASLNELNFMELLEKWTSDCPQLKARIMQKYATLREEENLTEERIVTVMEPFFAQNPVMMEAFKAMFSLIYRPQSTSMDFEVIDLEMEEKEEPGEDLNFETAKLPEEHSVPATHTCACYCHSNTTSLPFSTRIKHCTKCCLKFQDGKVFVHNGRIMKPVNFGFTSPEVAREIEAGTKCITCLKPTKSSSIISLSSLTASTNTPNSTIVESGIKVDQSPFIASSSSGSAQSSEPVKPWTRDEDFIMLTVYQAEQNITAAIKRLAEHDLPTRTSDEIEIRFMELTSILQGMTESENPTSSTADTF